MGQRDDLTDATRRTVLKATAAALGIGAASGTASAHEWQTGPNDSEIDGGSPTAADTPGNSENATVVGYHSLGDVSTEGQPMATDANPHYGAQTEIRVRGDYAYVSFFSSDDPTPGRGMAIVDISAYNDLEPGASEAEVKRARMSVVSYVRNNSTATAVMDLKVSDDGDYVFFGTQPFTALFTADQNGEAADPTPNLEDESFTEVPGAVVAVDVSDKGNPETVGAFQVAGLGVHNLFHHRIGGEEYVFAVHDQPDGAGMYVLRFDRATGQLEPVNLWTLAGDARQGEYAGDTAYIHDVEVQDDPVTGTPTAYLAYWEQGLQVLDVSNPEDITQIGFFEMGACHFASPAPKLWETPSGQKKRVVVASQEISGSESRTGDVHLVDASGVWGQADVDAGLDIPSDVDPTAAVRTLPVFDTWEWQDTQNGTETEDAEDLSFGNFQLSPHNSDVVVDEDGELWIHQAHYHGGIRYLQAVERSDGTIDLTERGFSRPKYDTPIDSRMQGLSEVVPNCWGAVESNGVTFASDINQGVHAVKADGIEVGGAPPAATASATDDGFAFTGGGTDQIDLSVSFPSLEHLRRYDSVHVRDRLAPGWAVRGGDAYTQSESGGSTFVEFDDPVTDDATLTYFAEAPAESGAYQFGPIELSTDGGETWHAVPGTIRSNYVAGTGLTLGTAAGAVGVLGSQRERLRERLETLLGDEE